jgi:hypothetical protein
MNVEPRCKRINHPTRNCPERVVWVDDCGNRFTAINQAAKHLDSGPGIRMKAVVDLGFFVLIMGTMLPTRPGCGCRVLPRACWA